MNTYDRRRLVLASMFTLAALPAMWVINRNDQSAAPKLGAAGVAPVGADTAPPTSAYKPDPPIFLDGPSTGVGPAVVDIVVPRPPTGTEASGKASFRRFADPTNKPCSTALAPWHALITVTNLNNGQSTTCVNTSSTGLPAGVDIVLHTELFTSIADLADAPIPVRLSW